MRVNALFIYFLFQNNVAVAGDMSFNGANDM
jgi:hypothetical protein